MGDHLVQQRRPARTALAEQVDERVAAQEVPGASSPGVAAVNNRGTLVGGYLDAAGVSHAFLMRGGRVTALDPPGAADDPAAANVFVNDLNELLKKIESLVGDLLDRAQSDEPPRARKAACRGRVRATRLKSCRPPADG